MKTITIVPLSTEKAMSLGAWELLRGTRQGATRLILQSALHPLSAPIINEGLPYESMDELYESAEDFDSLNLAIADRLVEYAPCVYAPVGGCPAALMEHLRAREREGAVKLRLLPCVPLAVAAFPEVTGGVFANANALPETLDVSQTLIISELDNALMAGELKLALSEYYPDEHELVMASLRKDGVYTHRRLKLFELDRVGGTGPACVLMVPGLELMEAKRYGTEELLRVLARLRAPNGCPWDAEQTHESLTRDLIEECCELLDAIDQADDEHMCEELGDVLLQLVFHAQIASEAHSFSYRDVTTGIVEKLIRRHPHVFGELRVDSSSEVLVNWEKIKKQEHAERSYGDTLRDVPRRLPALMRAQKLQKRAGKAGFDWDKAEDCLYKLYEEADELKAALAAGEDAAVAEELGDVLFTAVNLVRLTGHDSEELMQAASDKFMERFCSMEALANSEGKAIDSMPLKEQDVYWERAKVKPCGTVFKDAEH